MTTTTTTTSLATGDRATPTAARQRRPTQGDSHRLQQALAGKGVKPLT
jgi:hypothetical protein